MLGAIGAPLLRRDIQQLVSSGVAELTAGTATCRTRFAQAMAVAVAEGFWAAAVENAGGRPVDFRIQRFTATMLTAALRNSFGALGAELARLPVTEAIAEIGKVYTSALPAADRKVKGIFYTPQVLTERLVDDATRLGMDWLHGKAISPACGGGAFLVEDARRMVAAMGQADPAFVVASIGRRLKGWDEDGFACWLSQLAVEAVVLPQVVRSGRRLPPIAECRNSLLADLDGHEGAYDLVNENPPFGKIKDTPEMRRRYARSLRGHPNAYGMFIDLGVHLAKPAGGIVALLTPTSWLSGSYFAALRRTLAQEARPATIALVHGRKDAFEDVLQEISLSCFVRGRRQDRAQCSAMHISAGEVQRDLTGTLVLPANPEEPWSLPRSSDDAALVTGMRGMRHRLRDYGYGVSTGPLVWNRAAKKGRMHAQRGPGRVPVVWAEAVSQDGQFLGLLPRRRSHAPFYQACSGKDANVVTRGCILAQRTTAKEQHRRLISAILPQGVIDQAGGRVAVENHLNMILPTKLAPIVAVETLAAFLATKVADTVLRCINASVAVSATELEALPLPAPDDLMEAMASADPESSLRRLYDGAGSHGQSQSDGGGGHALA